MANSREGAYVGRGGKYFGIGFVFGLVLHFADPVISVENIMHNFGLLGEVVVRIPKPFTCINFVGNGHLSPRDPKIMCEPDVLATFSSGYDGSSRSRVPT